MLPRAYGFNTGDAAMAENPYNSTGIAPHRMYVIGTDYASGNYPGGIHVWYSDDGAATWSSGSQLAWDERLIVDPNGHHWFDDKPSIAVSYYSGTSGVVYATFVRIDLDSNTTYNPSQIFVLMSTNGGQSFVETAILSSNYVSPYPNYYPPSDDPHSPQIAVDASTGNVFLFWLDWNKNHIYCAYSGPNADTFTGLAGVDTGSLLGPTNDLLPMAPDGSNVRGRSMLSIRADWPCHNFGVTWHERESTTSNTNVKFGVLDAGTFAWSGPASGAPGLVTDDSPSVREALHRSVRLMNY